MPRELEPDPTPAVLTVPGWHLYYIEWRNRYDRYNSGVKRIFMHIPDSTSMRPRVERNDYIRSALNLSGNDLIEYVHRSQCQKHLWFCGCPANQVLNTEPQRNDMDSFEPVLTQSGRGSTIDFDYDWETDLLTPDEILAGRAEEARLRQAYDEVNWVEIARQTIEQNVRLWGSVPSRSLT